MNQLLITSHQGHPGAGLGALAADVFYDKKIGTYGCHFSKDGCIVKTEMFLGHAENYAHDAAENYTLGIKKLFLTE
jgi:hypothetical protein